MDAIMYNSYNVAPPYSGVVNNINIPYAQQSSINAMGGPMYNYSNQNMYSQSHNSFTQNQTAYPQPSVHVPPPQNHNMQAPRNQNAYRQEAPPPVQVDLRANGQPLIDPNMIAKAIR